MGFGRKFHYHVCALGVALSSQGCHRHPCLSSRAAEPILAEKWRQSTIFDSVTERAAAWAVELILLPTLLMEGPTLKTRSMRR